MNIVDCRMHEHRQKAVVKGFIVVVIMLSSEEAPNTPFPSRNRALGVTGKDEIEAHRRNCYWN